MYQSPLLQLHILVHLSSEFERGRIIFARHRDHDWHRALTGRQVEKNLGLTVERRLSGSVSLSQTYCPIPIHFICHCRCGHYEQEEGQ